MSTVPIPDHGVEVIAHPTSVPASPRTASARGRVWWPSAGTVRGGLLGGIATASGMALTATSGWLIVRASEQPVILTLLTAIVAVRAFGMARPVFRYWERLTSHDAALAMLAERRTSAYEALVPLTPARLGRRRRSDVLTGVVDDLTDVVDAQVRVAVPVISTAVAGGLAIVLTLLLSLPVGLVMLGLGVAVCLISTLAAHLESRSLPELLAARAEVTRVSELMASQSGELRAVGGWATALGWLDEAHASLDRVTRRISAGRAVAASLFLVAVGAAVAATAVIAQDLAVSTPVKALLVLTPVAVSEAVTPLVDAMRALARARGSEHRIDALLDLAPAVADEAAGADDEAAVADAPAPGDDPGHADDRAAGTRPEQTAYASSDVRARALTASWTDDRTDLAPTDLDVPAGSRVAVTGPNGSGKSTLLAVLARHLDPSGGTYLLGGTDVLHRPLEETRGHIAVVDDETHVFATTLRNNLTLARPDADDAEVGRALRAAGLTDLLEGLPDGLDTTLGSSGRGLSGGERARLGIARAHVSGRPVVLLDEPVAHLDPPTARAVVEDLTRLGSAPGTTGVAGTNAPAQTIIMVTHRDDGADLFDQVLEVRRPSGTMSATTAGGTDLHDSTDHTHDRTNGADRRRR
ncbi:thiol reductant ABC exporter subunit CydC [Terrabacter sp. Soil810]|uniref:thiol reductant ABC exporter subunit CydC n=1 Tax=Terrabacter sp. Soil810 TaxID=1736418 RepID=UPI0009EAD8D5|nr:thiol reductant ABC exporter subunit CydC [Terrabacter sp. Soil810]